MLPQIMSVCTGAEAWEQREGIAESGRADDIRMHTAVKWQQGLAALSPVQASDCLRISGSWECLLTKYW